MCEQSRRNLADEDPGSTALTPSCAATSDRLPGCMHGEGGQNSASLAAWSMDSS